MRADDERFIQSLLTAATVAYFNFTRPTGDNNGVFEADYVIAGGGSAGCIVAARFSELPGIKVLLLESGGEASKYTDIPGISEFLKNTSTSTWLCSTPQKFACQGQKENRCPLVVGHVLGGGGTHNFEIFNRGNRMDFDEWAQLGAKGWSFDDVLPFFKKLENFTDDLGGHGDRTYRGSRGPVGVTTKIWPFFQSSRDAFLAAAKERGLPYGDYNGDIQKVFTESQSNIKNGQRQCSEVTYIRPIRGVRDNIRVLTFATVRKVLFNTKSSSIEGFTDLPQPYPLPKDSLPRAIGVEFTINGTAKVYKAMAKREVILSAGSLRTPQLLMLSGIGPARQLKKFKIPPIATLEGVGRNFQDHYSVVLYATSNIPLYTTTLQQEYELYKANRTGRLAFTDTVGIGFGAISKSAVDYQITFYPVDFTNDTKRTVQLEFDVNVAKPLSRGTVRLRSTNINGNPIVDPNYLSESIDGDHIRVGIKTVIELLKTDAFKAINAELIDPKLDECKRFKLWSDGYLDCLIRTSGKTYYHYAGTAKMGDNRDSLAVGDNHLRVRKVLRLRVIDASVMPKLVRANTNAATMMIAEKGSDLIKKAIS